LQEFALAFFFGKKKDEPAAPAPAGTPGAPAPVPAKPGEKPKSNAIVFDEGKASKFFQHAKTVQETGNYEYAMQLWLSGVRLHPNGIPGIESFFAAAAQFLNDPASKKGPGKDLVKSVSGSTDVDKYLRALLDWAMKPAEAFLALKAMESATSLGLRESAVWVGERAFALCLREKNDKRRKELLMKVAQAYVKVEAADRAVQAAEAALKADPSDGELSAWVRDLAATATMSRGGYGNSGKEGGFRDNIRDATKQRQLEESDRIVKTEETSDRLVSNAEDEFIKRPNDMPTMEVLAKRLLERGKPQDEARAFELYMQMYTQFNTFRFRELAGDIKIRQQARKVRELERMVEKASEAEKGLVQSMLQNEVEALLKLETTEFKQRVAEYPTDLGKKYELGKRYYQMGNYDEAIALFQQSQADAKLRVMSLAFLARSFQKISYFDEAVQTYRGALAAGDMAPEMNLELQYDLMTALMDQGKASKNAESIRESDKIASAIAMKQFNYRDVKQKRDEIKKLLTEIP
jgi:tetratricopeptide (TPR) repeat protein